MMQHLLFKGVIDESMLGSYYVTFMVSIFHYVRFQAFSRNGDGLYLVDMLRMI